MPLPLILDTDIGTDIDDAYALALILASPELELRGVTVVHNRTDQRAQLALKMLYETGHEHVPVAMGRLTGQESAVNQYPWAAGFDATRPVAQSAAEFLVAQVNAAPGELTILAVGPFTNLAEALALDPDLPLKVKEFVIMGGCVGWPGGGQPEIMAEYNVQVDIPASQALFRAASLLLVVPLDATRKVRLEADFRARLAARQSPLTDALTAMLALWPGEAPTLHDPLAVGMLLDEGLCGLSHLCLEVDDEGFTRPVPGGLPNARVAVTPQVGRFLQLFMERLLGQDLRRA